MVTLNKIYNGVSGERAFWYKVEEWRQFAMCNGVGTGGLHVSICQCLGQWAIGTNLTHFQPPVFGK